LKVIVRSDNSFFPWNREIWVLAFLSRSHVLPGQLQYERF